MGNVMFPGVVGVRQAPARPSRQGGVQAQHARGGARATSGARVVGKRTGMRNGSPVVTVTMSDGTERTYLADRLVDGLTARTDLLAGPVRAGRGVDRPARVGRRDGEAAGDRHSRLIDSITYDTAMALGRSGRALRGVRARHGR
jgi:hypothetical protein